MNKISRYVLIAVLTALASMSDAFGQYSYNYSRGLEAAQNENVEEALEYFYKEVEDNEKNADAYFFIALFQYDQEDYGRALSAADKAVKFAPKKDKEGKSYALALRAKIYGALGQNGYALTDLNNAILEYPENDDAYEDRANLYYDMEMYGPAAAWAVSAGMAWQDRDRQRQPRNQGDLQAARIAMTRQSTTKL